MRDVPTEVVRQLVTDLSKLGSRPPGEDNGGAGQLREAILVLAREVIRLRELTTFAGVRSPGREAVVVVEGRQLSDGEVMTLRVALSELLVWATDPEALGSDEVGRGITANYAAVASALQAEMVGAANRRREGT